MKKTASIKVKFNEQDAKKLAYVAKNEGMSVEKLLVFLARQKIAYFERTKGQIKDTSGVSMDEFEILEQK
ncbi:MAG: hypothetical protein IKA43_05405 [Clostridia bacterium]|nr:hypothetical protein [Clostridia bacterium]MBR2296823.1 hypothetical protein [Clostridia bacterium]